MKNQVEISNEELEMYTNQIKNSIENSIENEIIRTDHGLYEVSHENKTVRLLTDKLEQYSEFYEIDKKVLGQSGYSLILNG